MTSENPNTAPQTDERLPWQAPVLTVIEVAELTEAGNPGGLDSGIFS